MAGPSGSQQQDAADASLLQPLLGGGGGSGGGEEPLSPTAPAPIRATVAVRGMQCSCCAVAAEHAIRSVTGVRQAGVFLLGEKADVLLDPRRASLAAVLSAIQGVGFSAELVSSTAETKAVKLTIGGMACSSCAAAVEGALQRVQGVLRASVSLTLEQAEVQYAEGLASPEQLVAAVEAAGFECTVLGREEVNLQRLSIEGLTCSSCTATVERALRKVPGVLDASVNLVTGLAEVRYDPDATGPRHLLAAVRGVGYGAELQTEQRLDFVEAGRAETARWRRQCVISALLTLPVFLSSMVLPMAWPAAAAWLAGFKLLGFPLDQLLRLGFATPVQFWCGRRFHRGAAAALRGGRANMDVLVSLGTNTAYLASLAAMAARRLSPGGPPIPGPSPGGGGGMEGMGEDFFETSAMLITLVLFGKYLESAAKGRTGEAIGRLCQLAPPTALLLECDASGAEVGEKEVPTSLLHRGDLVKVLPGACVPIDGVVVEGQSHVDESMLTGEPVPVSKGPGSAVIGGTVNAGGPLRLRVARIGADTALSQIVRLVESAQMSKAPIQAFADRVSAVFVPIIVALSLLTFAVWCVAGARGWYPDSWLPPGQPRPVFALLFAISVLVIACPCALGLATPTAVMVGCGVAAAQGILIKGGGDALERACRVKTVAFDKTGTLTAGRPAVVDCRVWHPQVSIPDVVRLAAAVESNSEHPLGAAIVEFAHSLAQHGKQQQHGWQGQQSGGSNNAVANGYSRSSGGGGGGESSISLPLPACRGVQVVVGQGVAAWVRLPSAPSANGSSANGTTGNHSGGSSDSSRDALLALQAGAAAGGAARLLAASPREPSARDLAVLEHATQPHATENGQEAAGQGGGDAQAAAAAAAGMAAEMAAAAADEVWVAVGSRRMVQQGQHQQRKEQVGLPAEAEAYMEQMESQGCTCVLVAVGGAVVATLAIQDPLKPEASGVIGALRGMGLRCALLTGDNWRTARAIARQLGIDDVVAELMPAGKVARIQELQAQGEGGIAMVGDGVNDSPALAQADVGIALGSGTDVAIEAADFVLMRSDLEDVLVSLHLSRKIFSRIRLNYVWALGYNALMLPVAAGAFFPFTHVQLPPWAAGACMAFSSVSVVLSSLALRWYRRPAPVLRELSWE